MTLEQLAIFIAVAEREHLTNGANAVGLSPSAASAAIKSLEAFYDVRLFDRVGRHIELTREGRVLLGEARRTLAQVRNTEAVLSELGSLRTGVLDLKASQTVANYWLPPRLLRFQQRFPGITIRFEAANTDAVAASVVDGSAELGFIEGSIDEPTLSVTSIVRDRLVVVATSGASTIDPDLRWIMRERGSGTRSVFEAAMARAGFDPAKLQVALVLPTNEAVLSAVRAGTCAAALSEMVVDPFVRSGELQVLPIDLPPRQFSILKHRERHLSAAARQFEALCREEPSVTPAARQPRHSILPLTPAHVSLIVSEDGGNGWNRREEHWSNVLEQIASGERATLVAMREDRVVGYGSLVWRSRYPGFADAGIAEVHDLATDRRERGKGIATSLIGALEDLARARGHTMVGLGVGLYRDYGAAQRLYARLGYAPDGNGVTGHHQPVAPGASASIDDDLLLWLTKRL